MIRRKKAKKVEPDTVQSQHEAMEKINQHELDEAKARLIGLENFLMLETIRKDARKWKPQSLL